MLCCVVQCCVILCCAALCCAVLYLALAGLPKNLIGDIFSQNIEMYVK